MKGALRWLRRTLPRHRFVFRCDIKGYCDHIDRTVLLRQLDRIVPERDVMRLLTQVIGRTVKWGGTFRQMHAGIGRGRP
ncbi:MAG: hypothetical protein WB783_06630 [Arenicellales bacterium]